MSWGTPEDPYPNHTIPWLLIYLQAMGGTSTVCDCGRLVLRAVDQDDYECVCGLVM